VLGVTGASVGEAVVTVSFSMDFISNVNFDCNVRMVSHIRHHGRTTMVIVGEMYDDHDRLLATMLASMMNVDKIEGIPREW
jgi:acyl-coenzyme A thioesterase PaaI-like protein